LSSLIRAMPKATYIHEMPALMPLLLRGLNLPDDEIRAGVIDTLIATTDPNGKDNELVSKYASSLVAVMLKNAKAEDMPSPVVRVAALRYIAILPSVVRYDGLHPQKAAVIRELSTCLDDPRRVVRDEAVYARTRWIQYTG